MRSDIFHPDFKAQPWWWEAWTPNTARSQDPPARTDIAIVGAGYGGLATALELRRNGVGAVVLERGDFGVGASTRNGGMISGGSNAPVNAFDGREFPEHLLYNGDPSLYLPLIGAWYRTRDWLDRCLAA